MTLSIAMCTFNGAAWVNQQLRSIAAQTRLPDELIVCDDHSSDSTPQILEDFARTAPFRVRVIHNTAQLGTAANFSQAISHCTGLFIALADQDDWWGAKKLRVLEDQLLAHDEVGIVFSDANLVDESLKPTGGRLWDTLYLDPVQRGRLTNGQALRVLTRTNVVTGATAMFRGRFKPLILPISPYWVHDGWVALLISAVSACAMVDEPLIDYRQHPRQQIGARRTTLIQQALIALDMDRDYFQLEARRWQDAYQRVRDFRHMLRRPQQDLAMLAEKAAFSRDRYLMRTEPAGRWDSLARHWHAGRYAQMAWGWKSLLQDLVLYERR